MLCTVLERLIHFDQSFDALIGGRTGCAKLFYKHDAVVCDYMDINAFEQSIH
jgi:hypothetical protein